MQKDKLIRHLNKQTNVTYLYWGHSTYVAGLKFPKVEKKCIGKINSKGEFEPNKTFLALSVEQQMETGLVDEPYLSPYTRGDVPRLVASELRKRKIKHGLPVDTRHVSVYVQK